MLERGSDFLLRDSTWLVLTSIVRKQTATYLSQLPNALKNTKPMDSADLKKDISSPARKLRAFLLRGESARCVSSIAPRPNMAGRRLKSVANLLRSHNKNNIKMSSQSSNSDDESESTCISISQNEVSSSNVFEDFITEYEHIISEEYGNEGLFPTQAKSQVFEKQALKPSPFNTKSARLLRKLAVPLKTQQC